MFRFSHKKYPIRVGIDATGSLLTIVVRLKRMGKNKFYFFSYEIPEPEEKLSYLPESVEDFLQQFDLTNVGVTIGLPFFKSTLGFLDVPEILRRKELHSYIKDKIELQITDNLDDYAYDYGVLGHNIFINNPLKTVVFCLSKQETIEQQLAYYKPLDLPIDAVEHLGIALMRGNDYFIKNKKSTTQMLLEITKKRLCMLIREGGRIHWMQSLEEHAVEFTGDFILQEISGWFAQCKTDIPEIDIKQIVFWSRKRYQFEFFDQLTDVQIISGNMNKVVDSLNESSFITAFGLSLWQQPHVID